MSKDTYQLVPQKMFLDKQAILPPVNLLSTVHNDILSLEENTSNYDGL